MAGEEAGKLEQSENWFIHFKFLFAREYFYIHIYHSYICLNGWRQSKALSGYWFFQLPVVFNSSEFQCSFFTTPKCTFETPAVHIKSWLTCVSSIWSLAWSHATRSDPEKKLIFWVQQPNRWVFAKSFLCLLASIACLSKDVMLS